MRPQVQTLEKAIEELQYGHNIDRVALVAQLRALASAVEHLARAVEAAAIEADPDPIVAEHLENARWELRTIW